VFISHATADREFVEEHIVGLAASRSEWVKDEVSSVIDMHLQAEVAVDKRPQVVA